jgi:hypothetical protein
MLEVLERSWAEPIEGAAIPILNIPQQPSKVGGSTDRWSKFLPGHSHHPSPLLIIEKHEVYIDLCGSPIVLTKRGLEERVRGYAVIVDRRIVQVICEECRKRF